MTSAANSAINGARTSSTRTGLRAIFSLLAPAGAALALLCALAPQPAEAVVYCRTVGVPKGCVVRPAPVVRAPAARAAVYCTRPGYPVGCVGGVGAPGLGVQPGVGVGAPGVGVGVSPVNRGGPVNRVGVR